MVGSRWTHVVSHARLRRSLAVAVYVSLVGFIAATYTDYGSSWDEAFYVDSGQAYLSHFFDMDSFAEEVPAIHRETHGAVFDGLYALGLRSLGRTGDLETLHLLKALVSSLAVVCVYLLGVRLEPDSLIPVAGMLLLVLLPTWLGHIFDAHMDGAATLLYALQMAAALPLLVLPVPEMAGWRRPLMQVVGLGLIGGISFSHRAPLVVVPASLFLLWLVQAVAARRLATWLAFAAVFVATAYAVVFVVDPYVRLEWATGFFDKIFHAANPSEVPALLVRFDGRVLPAGELPATYLLTWMGMSIPVLTLGLAGVGTVRLATWLARPAEPRRRLEAAFLLLVLALPILAVVATGAVVFDGWRHLLFLAVPIAVVAGLGLGWILLGAPPRGARLLAFGFLVAALLIARSMMRLHPYEYVYVNELVGGLRATEGRFENDYWGKSYKEAAEWVRTHAEARPSRLQTVFVCGPAPVAEYYFARNMVLTGRAKEADYIICFSRPGWDAQAPRSRPDHRIERDGVALSRIWAR